MQGCSQAIGQAHDSLQPGSLQVTSGELLEANINRSRTAYENNPAEERAKFEHDTDKTLTLLKVLDAQGRCACVRAAHFLMAALACHCQTNTMYCIKCWAGLQAQDAYVSDACSSAITSQAHDVLAVCCQPLQGS